MHILWRPRNHTAKWANGTKGGTVCIILYAKFSGFLCVNKSLYIFLFLQRSMRLINTVLRK